MRVILFVGALQISFCCLGMPSILEHGEDTADIFFNTFAEPLLTATAQESSFAIQLPNGATDPLTQEQQSWTSKSGLVYVLNGYIDQNARTYATEAFGVTFSPNDHRLAGHTPFGQELSEEMVQAIQDKCARKGIRLSKDEVQEKNRQVTDRLYRDMVTTIQLYSAYAKGELDPVDERIAGALARMVQLLHIIDDTIPEKNKRFELLVDPEVPITQMRKICKDLFGRSKIGKQVDADFAKTLADMQRYTDEHPFTPAENLSESQRETARFAWVNEVKSKKAAIAREGLRKAPLGEALAECCADQLGFKPKH